MPISRKCSYTPCQNSVKVYPYKLKLYVYCSRSCTALGMYERGIKAGFQKGNKEGAKQEWTAERRAQVSKQQQGENNSNWNNGRSQDYYRSFLKQKCNRCTKDAQMVHHKDHNRSNNKKDNLESLCYSCHIKHHKPQLWRNKKKSV